jgi:hypothetical protein
MAAAYTPPVTSEAGMSTHSKRTAMPRRICARVGCGELVHKPTAKYCSIKCCSIDPARHERLRNQARRASARPIPMLRQLRFEFQPSSFDPEAQLNELCRAREDVPAGMSRLTG